MAPTARDFNQRCSYSHLWSSAKSCRRKLHSCSLVLPLLSHPLLHCSRSKAPSQRQFLQQPFRGVAEGAESSKAPSHPGSLSHCEVHALVLGQQWDSTAVLALSQAGKPFWLPWKIKPDLPKGWKRGCGDTVPCKTDICRGKAPMQHWAAPGKSRSHNFASQTETETS